MDAAAAAGCLSLEALGKVIIEPQSAFPDEMKVNNGVSYCLTRPLAHFSVMLISNYTVFVFI